MTSISREDEQMFLNQVVCGSCHHRFTTLEDAQMHILITHEKQPTPREIMEMLEQILITVSREPKDDRTGAKTSPPAPDSRF